MKNLKIVAIALILIGTIQTSKLESAYRRGGASATRGLFSRTSTPSSLLGKTTGIQSTTPTSCPISRSLFTSTTSSKARALGTQARAFAGKHKGKLWATGAAAGTAGAAYAYTGKNQAQKTEAHLEEYFDLVTKYHNKDEGKLLALIKQLKEDGAINARFSYPYGEYDYASYKEKYPKTILEQTIFAIKDEDTKAKIVSLLIENGALPTDYALTLALSRNDIVGLDELNRFRRSNWQPQNKVLEIILPFYNDTTLFELNRFVNTKLSYFTSGSKEQDETFNEPYRKLKTLIDENLQRNKQLRQRDRAERGLIEKRYEALEKEVELK